MLLDEIAVEWKISKEDIIEAVKFLRDNRFDSMDAWELEFSSDYTELRKIKCFDDVVRDEVFRKQDNLKKVIFKR